MTEKKQDENTVDTNAGPDAQDGHIAEQEDAQGKAPERPDDTEEK